MLLIRGIVPVVYVIHNKFTIFLFYFSFEFVISKKFLVNWLYFNFKQYITLFFLHLK